MSRGGIDSRVVGGGEVALGNNEYETGLINVAANSIVKAGTVLIRAGNKFTPATEIETTDEVDTDAGTETVSITTTKKVVINPYDVENKGAAAADLSLRVIISGPVRADMLKIGNRGITDAEKDAIRGSSIIALRANDISRTE